MKSQIPDQEKRLKEKILAHRVPFEEQAWDAMDALLEGEKGKKAPAELPAPQETPTRSFKYRRFFILIFLFSAVAVFSAKMGLNLLENIRPKATSTLPAKKLKNGKQDDALPAGLTSATTAEKNTDENLRTTPGTPVDKNTANQPTTTTPQNGQKTTFAESLNTNTPPTFRNSTTNPDKGWAVGPAKQKSSATDLDAGQSPFVANNTTGNKENVTPPIDAVAPNKTSDQTGNPAPPEPFKPLDNLAFLPLLPLDSLNSARELPEATTVPVKNKTRRNVQHGWLLGGNLTMVDYQTGRLNLMPVVGYHVGFSWLGGTLETGVQIKAINGFNKTANFEYNTPGGSEDIYLELNSLLLVESPLVYKHAFKKHARHHWLAGIRPALVFPVNNYGSYSSSGNGLNTPNSQLLLSDGVRWFDLGLTAGWQWRIDERWALDLRYTQGLFDLTHDNFFGNTDYVLNSDFQLTFRHYVSTYKNR